jgi:hypothetical protein
VRARRPDGDDEASAAAARKLVTFADPRLGGGVLGTAADRSDANGDDADDDPADDGDERANHGGTFGVEMAPDSDAEDAPVGVNISAVAATGALGASVPVAAGRARGPLSAAELAADPALHAAAVAAGMAPERLADYGPWLDARLAAVEELLRRDAAGEALTEVEATALLRSEAWGLVDLDLSALRGQGAATDSDTDDEALHIADDDEAGPAPAPKPLAANVRAAAVRGSDERA